MSSMTVLETTPTRSGELIADLRAACRGTVSGSADAAYDAARGAWNLVVDQRPAAVVAPVDVEDVAAVIAVARRHGVRVAPQSTGHNGGGLDSLDGAVLLRTIGLKGVEVDAEARTIRVGAGTQWGEALAATAPHGLAPLAGSAGDVGVVGYLLGGGLSFLGRKFGLASASLRAADVVLPDGSLVRADETQNSELLWALRGGGAGVGVVVAVELDLFDVTEMSAGQLFFGIERAPEILRAWRNWAATAPEEITTSARMMRFPPDPAVPEPLRGGAFVIIDGAYVGPHEQCAELLKPLASRAPLMDTWAPAPIEALCQLHLDPPQPVPAYLEHTLLDGLDDATLEALVETAGADSGTSTAIVELRQLGGAMARSTVDGARTSVDAELSMVAIAIPGGPFGVETLLSDLDAALKSVASRAAGTLSSWVDNPNRGTTHSPEVATRLGAVRSALDPETRMQGSGDAA